MTHFVVAEDVQQRPDRVLVSVDFEQFEVGGGSLADLNEDLPGNETLVAYAAAAGTTAADGRGRNSPYTAALLLHLETPLEIGLLFRRVRAQVLAATNGA